jgi:hypothetical protein
MENPNELFTNRLGAFIELLKDTQKRHAEYTLRLGEWQKNMLDENSRMQRLAAVKLELNEVSDYDQQQEFFQQQIEDAKEFEKAAKAFRTIFQRHIDDTNFQLGMYSSHWGGYIEGLGVQYMLNTLRKEHGVHTSFQKFKRYWHKSKNVEIDLLAVSDTHAYIVEVKNQLKEETFVQMLKILDKIKEKVPEYAHLKMRPVFVCMHAEEKIIRTATMGGLWILRYKGFDRDSPIDSFEWLRKDP